MGREEMKFSAQLGDTLEIMSHTNGRRRRQKKFVYLMSQLDGRHEMMLLLLLLR